MSSSSANPCVCAKSRARACSSSSAVTMPPWTAARRKSLVSLLRQTCSHGLNTRLPPGLKPLKVKTENCSSWASLPKSSESPTSRPSSTSPEASSALTGRRVLSLLKLISHFQVRITLIIVALEILCKRALFYLQPGKFDEHFLNRPFQEGRDFAGISSGGMELL